MDEAARSFCELAGPNSFWDRDTKECKCQKCFKNPPFCREPDCQNGGTQTILRDKTDTFSFEGCKCSEFYEGVCCERKVCAGGGRLVGQNCTCPIHRKGSFCEEFLNPCDNAGKWLNEACVCHKGFDGNFCEKFICKHGEYQPKANSCICSTPLFTGDHCDVLNPKLFGFCMAGTVLFVCIAILCLLCLLHRSRRNKVKRMRMRSPATTPTTTANQRSRSNSASPNVRNKHRVHPKPESGDGYSVNKAYASMQLPTYAEAPPPYDEAVKKKGAR